MLAQSCVVSLSTKHPSISFRSDGPAGHAVPGAGQHLQLGDGERAQGRGTDGRRDLGRHVHLGKYNSRGVPSHIQTIRYVNCIQTASIVFNQFRSYSHIIIIPFKLKLVELSHDSKALKMSDSKREEFSSSCYLLWIGFSKGSD